MKLNPSNKEDREFLARVKNPRTGISLLEEYEALGRNKSRASIELDDKKSLGTASEVKDGQTKKYSNTKVEYRGIQFDSKWELECYQHLLWLEKAKYIHTIEVHKKYEIIHNDILICKINLDFTFSVKDEIFVADAKSPFTAKKYKFTLQKKMMRAFYGMDVIALIKGESDLEKIIRQLTSD